MNNYNEVKKELNFGTIKRGVFGTYDAVAREHGKNLEITELDILEHINNSYDIIDIKDIIEDISEKNKEDLQDRLKEVELCDIENIEEYIEELTQIETDRNEIDKLEDIDTIEKLLDYEGDLIDISELKEHFNSYNWNSQAIVDFARIKIEGIEYSIIKFHLYGDARANYTDYIMIEFDECAEFLHYSKSISFDGVEVSTDISKENGMVDIYSDNFDEYDVYLEAYMDDLEAIKEEVKKLMEV